jgi:hypothetical protein
MLPRIATSSCSRSAGTIKSESCLPIASSALYPKMRSADLFQLITVPDSDFPMIASFALATMAAKLACSIRPVICRLRLRRTTNTTSAANNSTPSTTAVASASAGSSSCARSPTAAYMDPAAIVTFVC